MPALDSTLVLRMDMITAMHNNENNSFTILAITGSWCFLAVFIVAMRLYTRLVMVKFIGWDDIAILISMAFGVGIFGCFVGESHWALGKHWQAITPRELDMHSKWQFAHRMLLLWALQGMRIGFMLFLIRLSPRKLFRMTLFSVIGFMTVYTFINWLVILLACTPISANWHQNSAKCMAHSVYTGIGLSNSILGLITNAILALIPMPIILNLQLNLRAKICFGVAFAMGMITVICGAVKTYHQSQFIGNQDRLYQDQFFVWGALELYVGIIAACLVSLKPLVGSFIEKTKSTIATTAELARSLHHGSQKVQSPKIHSPRLDEKMFDQPKQMQPQDCPDIQVFGAHTAPSSPRMGTAFGKRSSWMKLPKSPVVDNEKESSWTKPPRSLFTRPILKGKHRPTPLNLSPFNRRASPLEISCMGGILMSPTPTHLPVGGMTLDFLDLCPTHDPEALQEQQQKQQTQLQQQPQPQPQTQETKQQKVTAILPSPSLTPQSIINRRLSIPGLNGLLTTPSPTWISSSASNDLDFFSLIKCRAPETLGMVKTSLPSVSSSSSSSSAGPSTPLSRRATMISVPEEVPVDQDAFFYYPYNRRSTLNPNNEPIPTPTSATTQTFKRYTSNDIKRRPSMAPSQNSSGSAFFAPIAMPEHNPFGPDGRMFFQVMSSGKFREHAQKAATDVVVNSLRRGSEDMPLSPFTMDPRQQMQQRQLGHSQMMIGVGSGAQQQQQQQVRRRVSVDVGARGEVNGITIGKERVDSSINTPREKKDE